MNYSAGDSHADKTFGYVKGVVRKHLGPVTMKRVRHREDPLLPAALAEMPLGPGDTVIFCFGEIDVRCHVEPMLREGHELTTLLASWIVPYLDRLAGLDTRGARKAVLGLPPPTTMECSYNSDFPVMGTLPERITYVLEANRQLSEGCARRGLIFIDVYTPFADERGALDRSKADESVHINAPAEVAAILARTL